MLGSMFELPFRSAGFRGDCRSRQAQQTKCCSEPLLGCDRHLYSYARFMSSVAVILVTTFGEPLLFPTAIRKDTFSVG